MAIKKRTSKPDTAEAGYVEDGQSEARHPLLNGLWLDVYRFVGANPHCTRRDVARGLDLPNNVATARIKELIDEGYLLEPLGVRKTNSSGRTARVLQATDRQTGGTKLDKVKIEVALTIDCNGVFGATARVIGGKQQAEQTTVISKKKLVLTAPHPDTYASEFTKSRVAKVSRMELIGDNADLIIDADFTALD